MAGGISAILKRETSPGKNLNLLSLSDSLSIYLALFAVDLSPGDEADGDRGVDVTAGHVTEGLGQRGHSYTKAERYSGIRENIYTYIHIHMYIYRMSKGGNL